MDPNACFTRILDLLYEGRIEEARDHIESLLEWMEKGGHEPNWKKIIELFNESHMSGPAYTNRSRNRSG